jgi:hypothetical protein
MPGRAGTISLRRFLRIHPGTPRCRHGSVTEFAALAADNRIEPKLALLAC